MPRSQNRCYTVCSNTHDSMPFRLPANLQIRFFKFNKVRLFYTDEAYGQSLSADLQVRGVLGE